MKAKIGMHLMGGPYYMPDALNDIYLDISKLFATEWASLQPQGPYYAPAALNDIYPGISKLITNSKIQEHNNTW